jgi:hypothetical protein
MNLPTPLRCQQQAGLTPEAVSQLRLLRGKFTEERP